MKYKLFWANEEETIWFTNQWKKWYWNLIKDLFWIYNRSKNINTPEDKYRIDINI